jgi:hypothetical protein
MERLELAPTASPNDAGTVVKAALEPLQDQLNIVAVGSKRKLDSISTDVVSVATSVSHFGGILSNVVRFLRSIRSETRAALQQILQTNMQTYAMLVASQNNIDMTPSLLLESNIQFEDAVGRTSSLPYQWFRHWEVSVMKSVLSVLSASVRFNSIDAIQTFEGLLRAEFKDVPGQLKVMGGEYHLIDAKKDGLLIKQDDWNKFIFPGSSITMSMIISQMRWQGGLCPRPSWKQPKKEATSMFALVTW